ncbi:MAG TPA: hypothetical protein VIM69_11085 [Opitutaceae bacterium]
MRHGISGDLSSAEDASAAMIAPMLIDPMISVSLSTPTQSPVPPAQPAMNIQRALFFSASNAVTSNSTLQTSTICENAKSLATPGSIVAESG